MFHIFKIMKIRGLNLFCMDLGMHNSYLASQEKLKIPSGSGSP